MAKKKQVIKKHREVRAPTTKGTIIRPEELEDPKLLEEPEADEYVPPEWLTPEHQSMRYLVREYYRAQAARIRAGNYLKRLEARGIEPDRLKSFLEDQKQGRLWEGRRRREIEKRLEDFPIWSERLKNLRGVGVVLAGGCIGEPGPLDRFNHASAVWKYWGLAVGKDGWAMRAEAGEKRPFNRRLKVLAWKISKSFVMIDGPYREFYRQRKVFEESRRHYSEARLRERRGAPPEAQIKGLQAYLDTKARRWTVKLFVAHLWQRSRELSGLPVTEPYVIAVMGHSDKIEPPF